MAFVVIVALMILGMWGYFKLFGGKADCGCKEKTS
jgi:hypothetical protein